MQAATHATRAKHAVAVSAQRELGAAARAQHRQRAQREAQNVDDAERRREVAAGEPDAVARAVIDRVIVRRADVGGVEDSDVAGEGS